MFNSLKKMATVSIAVAIGLVYPQKHYLSPGKMLQVYNDSSSPELVRERICNFEYERDSVFEPPIKPSYLFLFEKKGDCKDFANFAYECASYNNVKCRFYLLFNDNGHGHASAIWKIKNKYIPICNVTCIGASKLKEYDSIKDINEMYLKAFKWKKIKYSYYATPSPFFWPTLSPIDPSNPKVEDF